MAGISLTWEIFGIISLCILEALLIVALLVSRAKRKRAEVDGERFAKLAEAEHRHLEEVVTNVPGSVWESIFEPGTTQRKARFVNQYVERMLGYSVEEWLSTPGLEMRIIHEDDRERVARETEAIFQSGKEGVLQFRAVKKDGPMIWQEAHMTAILDDAGKPIGLRGVTMDINERKLAEESLRQSENRNRAILSAIPDLMFLQSRDGVYLDYHASEPQDLLVPPDAFLGKNMRDVLPTELARHFFSCFQRAEATGELQVLEYLLPLDGEDRYFEARVVRTRGNEILSVVRDISERKRAEEEQHLSDERLNQAINVARFGVFDHDHLSGELHGSKLTHEIHGWSDEEQPSVEALFAQLHPEDREAFLAAVERAHDPAGDGFFSREYRIVRHGGEVCWVSSRAQTFFESENGTRRPVRTIGAELDITERKHAEEALQKSVDEVNKLKNQLQEENIYLQEEIKLAHNFDEIVGHSDSIKYVLYKIEQVAPTNSTVLITGETGTGKELVARAIHSTSLRQNRPLVKVNCAALSAGLIESELFGHEKGSFTGAVARKIGRFELANGATIFLDEIGELPLELQVKLLRVIHEGEFERLGSSKTVKADVRIIAATNRNLPLEVQKGNFREDLWYRLNVFPITVPPLRHRVDDIPFLVEHFVRRFSKRLGREISSVSPATLRTFMDYSWPGNIRELANVIERAVINTQGAVLRVSDRFEEPRLEGAHTSRKTLDEIERDYIIRTLSDNGWRIEGPSGAAKSLGLNPSTLRTRMAKLGIQKPNQSVV